MTCVFWFCKEAASVLLTFPLVSFKSFCLGRILPSPHETFCRVSLLACVRTTHPGAEGVCASPGYSGAKAWAGSHMGLAPSTQSRPASWCSAGVVLRKLSTWPQGMGNTNGHEGEPGTPPQRLAEGGGCLPWSPRSCPPPLQAAAPNPAPTQELSPSSWSGEGRVGPFPMPDTVTQMPTPWPSGPIHPPHCSRPGPSLWARGLRLQGALWAPALRPNSRPTGPCPLKHPALLQAERAPCWPCPTNHRVAAYGLQPWAPG